MRSSLSSRRRIERDMAMSVRSLSSFGSILTNQDLLWRIVCERAHVVITIAPRDFKSVEVAKGKQFLGIKAAHVDLLGFRQYAVAEIVKVNGKNLGGGTIFAGCFDADLLARCVRN